MNFIKNVYADESALHLAAAEAIVALACHCVAATGRFNIALAGGNTPRQTYALLAVAPLVRRMPWAQTRVYFSDERHVPLEHPDSNYHMALEAMLKRVSLRSEQIFTIPTEHDDVAACAEWYNDLLHVRFQRRTDRFPPFDLVMAGVGPDGHIASIFPGTPAVTEKQLWVTSCDPLSTNPKVVPPVKRITITPPVIQNAGHVFVMATGAEKAQAMAGVFASAEPLRPPVARLLRRCNGTVTFFLDAKAVR